MIIMWDVRRPTTILGVAMHYFDYKGKELYCEEVALSELAGRFGTPLYVYSRRTFQEHFQKIKTAFSSVSPLICYSVKANSNIAILKLLVGLGAGLDVVSGGELYRAKKAACPAEKIVYASVGKTEKEIKEAVKYGILMFNVESLPELRRINNIAGILNKKVLAALRVNPDIEPGTHKYITTGKGETKFGMDIAAVENILLNREEYGCLNIVGIHIHIGSQIVKAAPFVKAIKKVNAMISRVEKKGIKLQYLNIGGGLGIVYDKENPQTAQDFAGKIMPLLKRDFKIILEPGRFIVGNAGVLISKVIYIKDTPVKRFIIVDAGMNDLTRPSLYEAYHKIIPLDIRHQTLDIRRKKADIVGPICESGDFLGKDRKLDVGDDNYIAVLGAGAYGFSMSSNYNSRPRPAEVLVDGSKVYCIRERETYGDLIRKEKMT